MNVIIESWPYVYQIYECLISSDCYNLPLIGNGVVGAVLLFPFQLFSRMAQYNSL